MVLLFYRFLTHLTLITSFEGEYYDSHFTDAKAEVE